MNNTRRTSLIKVGKYLGKSFITRHNSHYSISSKGKFKGRPSIEGAEVMYIAGLEERLYRQAVNYLDITNPENKKGLDRLIKEYGQEIKPGLLVVVSLTPRYVLKKGRHGIVTSPVKEIREGPGE